MTAPAVSPVPSAPTVRVLSADDIRRAVSRISHEIVERNRDLASVVIIGLQTGGVWMAGQLQAAIAKNEGVELPLGYVDVSMYRDDIALRPVTPSAPSEIPVDLTDATVVLVDDVLFTGRTVRAALEALNEFGRPRAVQLAVMVDRGHRQLPIRPDYVGKNIPTQVTDEVLVTSEMVTVTPADAHNGGTGQ